jgi:hypothetical protein
VVKRIQRQRTKGWRMPENAVYVGRPTAYGNPFRVPKGRRPLETARARQHAVDNYRNWLFEPPNRRYWHGKASEGAHARLMAAVPALRGKDLVCWCALDQPCHADVLIEYLERG